MIKRSKGNNCSAWIIHESRLTQMQGVAHEAVVVHREWAATQQMRQDRLARRVKNADYD